MKICLFCQNLYTLGGVQRVITTLINELVKDGSYDITVVMPFEMKGIKLFKLDERIKLYDRGLLLKKSKLPFKKYILALNKRTGILNFKLANAIVDRMLYSKKFKDNCIEFINKEKFDVVIGVHPDNSLLLASISDKINCIVIGWQHSTYDSYFKIRGKGWYGLKAYARECFPKLDRVLVLTNSDKKDFDSNLNINSSVFYNPVPKGNNVLSDLKNKNILFVGRLVIGHKGLDFLMEIINKISATEPDITFTIVGDGPDKNYIIKAIKNMKIEDKVNVVGNTDNVYQYYERADLLLQTSRFEGFGMTIIEAMSCGVPAVSFHNYGPDEIIRDGVDGYLIPKFDIEQFVDKSVELMRDYDLRKRLSAACIERAESFSVDSQIEKLKKFF